MLTTLLLVCAPTPQEPVRPPDEEIPRGWLLEHQDADGRWDADGYAKHDSPAHRPGAAELGRPQDDVLATALTLWACLGDGRSLSHGVDAGDVARGVRWLLSKQDLGAGLVREVEHEDELRHHAIATVVLCDFHFVDVGPLLRDAGERGLKALVDAQQPDGSWGDVRTTAWALYAFEAARDAGIEVRDEAAGAGRAWLMAATGPDGLVRDAGGRPDAVATSLLVLMELLDDPARETLPDQRERGARLLDELADAPRDGETWFALTALTYQLGGEVWKRLEKPLKRQILDTQERGGPNHGSWDPGGAPGGRVVETAWSALSLEIYFRYSRVFPAR